MVGVLVPRPAAAGEPGVEGALAGRRRDGGTWIPGRARGTVAAGADICGRGAILGGAPGALGRGGMTGAPGRASGTVAAWSAGRGAEEEGGTGAPGRASGIVVARGVEGGMGADDGRPDDPGTPGAGGGTGGCGADGGKGGGGTGGLLMAVDTCGPLLRVSPILHIFWRIASGKVDRRKILAH